MSSRKMEKLGIVQRQRAARTADDLSECFAKPALPEVLRARDAIKEWLQGYFAQLGLTWAHEIRCALNDYTKDRLGLQSATVRVLGKDNKEVLADGDTKAPTIGVIAEDLLEKGDIVIVPFCPDQGTAGELTVLSDGLRIETAPPELKMVITPGKPSQGTVLTASDSRDECFVVMLGTSSKGGAEKHIFKEMEQCRDKISGVYACRYRKDTPPAGLQL